jgi:hypothetical protein
MKYEQSFRDTNEAYEFQARFNTIKHLILKESKSLKSKDIRFYNMWKDSKWDSDPIHNEFNGDKNEI